jgi:CelD/BcsL family acetyltransferase involved in cellulose biosynthesis
VLAVRAHDGHIVGGLPLLDVTRPFGGRRWVSLPFTDYCPLLTATDAADTVARAVTDAVAAHQGTTVEVRAPLCAVERVYTSVHAVRHTLELGSDTEAAFKRISKHHRRNIRRAEQGDLCVQLGTTTADMAVFYRLHVATRQRLGVPVQSWHFFERLASLLRCENLGFVSIVRLAQAPVAAAVFLAWNGTLVYKYGASDARYWAHRPNNLLFWDAIRWGCERGYATLDWGRSDFDSRGLREFKTGWGAIEEPLAYSVVGDRPSSPGSGRGGRFMAAVIRRSPIWVCRAIGEALYRYAA